MGTGVFLRLFLPADAGPATPDVALNLNLKEREMPFAIDATGAWTIESPERASSSGLSREAPRLCYVRSVPNALHLPGLLRGSRGRHGAPRGRGARAPARGHFAGTNFMAVPFMQ